MQPSIAPFGSHHFMQAPTQFASLSEHHPCTVGEQVLKSIVQQPVPVSEVEEVGMDERVGLDVVGGTVGTGDIVGEAETIDTSAQLKNCSGMVALLVPSSLKGDLHVDSPGVQYESGKTLLVKYAL